MYARPSTNAVGRSVLDANPKGDSRNNVYHFLTLVLESTKVGATVSLTVAWRNGGRRHTRTHGRVLGPNQDCCYVEGPPADDDAVESAVSAAGYGANSRRNRDQTFKGQAFVCP